VCEWDIVQIADHDIQCLLCDRVIAEWRGGQGRFNPHYGRNARHALATGRCAYCGGRLVHFQVISAPTGLEALLPTSGDSRAG